MVMSGLRKEEGRAAFASPAPMHSLGTLEDWKVSPVRHTVKALGVVVPAAEEDPGVPGQRVVLDDILGKQHATIRIFYAGRPGSEHGQEGEGELPAGPLGDFPGG